MAKPKGGLGRGLSTLIPDNEYQTDKEPMFVSVEKIAPYENQPRKVFNKEKLEELCESIRAHGIIQPLIVVKKGDIYKIVAGERRFRASLMAGLKEVPVVVKDLSDEEIVQLALIENLQREDISEIEAAMAYKQLSEKYGMTQEMISKKIGKSRTAIANTMRLTTLDDEIKKLIYEKKLSAGHARAVLMLKDEKKRVSFANYIVEHGLSVRAAEKLSAVYEAENEKKPKSPAPPKKLDAHYVRIEDELTAALGTKVNLKPKKDKGVIQIEYYSNEELARLIKLINSVSD